MWERWIHDNNGNLITGRESDMEGFAEYMKENLDDVYELMNIAIGGWVI